MLNSAAPFELNLTKRNLAFGQTKSQLGALMEYDAKTNDWVTRMGVAHWYVADSDSEADEGGSSSPDEDQVRRINMVADT